MICDKCAYGSINIFGDRSCNYHNINPSGKCVQEIIKQENKEYFENREEVKKMTFKQLQEELVNSMKSKDKVRKAVISDIMSTAKNMAIEAGCKDDIKDEIVEKAILKVKKICQEQIDTCPADRIDTLNNYKANMIIINEFAPKMMNENEVREAVSEILSAGPDIGITNIGSAMKICNLHLKGKADGKMISTIVKEIFKA